MPVSAHRAVGLVAHLARLQPCRWTNWSAKEHELTTAVVAKGRASPGFSAQGSMVASPNRLVRRPDASLESRR